MWVCMNAYVCKNVWCIFLCMYTPGSTTLFLGSKKIRLSTTHDGIDNVVLRNHVHNRQLLACKTCRPGDGRMDRKKYFCGHCNGYKERSHFSKNAIDNWNKRGRKAGALKCKEVVKATKSGTWVLYDRQHKHKLYVCKYVCVCAYANVWMFALHMYADQYCAWNLRSKFYYQGSLWRTNVGQLSMPYKSIITMQDVRTSWSA